MRSTRSLLFAVSIAVVVLIAIALLITSGTPMMVRDPNQPVAPAATPRGGTSTEQAAGEIVDFTVNTAEGLAGTVQDLVNRLIVPPQNGVLRLLMLLGGIVLLVAGWRVSNLIVVIAGFLIGALIASSLVTTNEMLVEVAALVIGGLVGALLSYFLYYVAVFLLGAYIGIMLTNALASAVGLVPVSAIALLIGGVIGGIVLIGISLEFMILFSALIGAQILVLIFGLSAPWLIVLAVLGVIIQLGLMRVFRYDYRAYRGRLIPFRRLPG